jgi:hypothetical protein
VTRLGGFQDNRAVIDASGLDNNGHHPQRYTAMLDWSPSEFSRLRLQYVDDRVLPEPDSQWYLQYIMSIGAHGAHQF